MLGEIRIGDRIFQVVAKLGIHDSVLAIVTYEFSRLCISVLLLADAPRCAEVETIDDGVGAKHLAADEDGIYAIELYIYITV